MKLIINTLLLIFFSSNAFCKGIDVFGIGVYDIKFDGSDTNQAVDLRFERRFDNALFDIGPKEDNFFFLKPFVGIELTSDSASYFLTGIYLDDNLGELIQGKDNKLTFTPSFGAGYYDNGSGENLGHNIEFRTSFEISYKLKNNNRLGISLSHISNANIGDKNPGVEIRSLSYHIPY